MKNILKISDKITGFPKGWRPHLVNLNNQIKDSSHVKEGHEMYITEPKQAEEELQTIKKTTLDGFWLTNLKGKLLEVNDSYCRMIGYTREELLNMCIADVEATESPGKVAQHINKIVAQGYDCFETRHKHKDGRVIAVEISVNYLDVGEGQLFVFARDITERKKAEEELANEAIQRRNLMEQSRDGLVILDQNGKVYEANRQFAEMLGYSTEEVLQLYVWDWDTQWTQEQLLNLLSSVDESGDHFETYWQRKNGTLCDVEISTNGATFGGQKRVFCVCRDITERKRSEEALREAEEKYRDLLDNTNELIQSVTPDGRFRYVNNGWKNALFYSDEEVAGLRVFDIIHPDYLEHYRMIFEKIKTGEDLGEIKTAFVSKYGSKVIVEGNVTCKWVDGELLYTRSILRDITENKHLEEQMFRLSSAVSMSTDYIVITDFDAKIIDINHKTLDMYGANSKDELLGRHFLELIDSTDRVMVSNDVGKIIEKGSLECREYTMISKKGKKHHVQVSTSLVRDADGKPMGMVRVGREVSNLN